MTVPAIWHVVEAPCDPIGFWARILPASGSPVVEWSERLTPYAAEMLVDEARGAGRGARLEIRVVSRRRGEEIRRLKRALAQIDGCEIVLRGASDA